MNKNKSDDFSCSWAPTLIVQSNYAKIWLYLEQIATELGPADSGRKKCAKNDGIKFTTVSPLISPFFDVFMTYFGRMGVLWAYYGSDDFNSPNYVWSPLHKLKNGANPTLLSIIGKKLCALEFWRIFHFLTCFGRVASLQGKDASDGSNSPYVFWRPLY